MRSVIHALKDKCLDSATFAANDFKDAGIVIVTFSAGSLDFTLDTVLLYMINYGCKRTGTPVREIIVMDVPSIEKPDAQQIRGELPKTLTEKLGTSAMPPAIRSYTWALSGDFSANLDLFGDANSEEDIDALLDYVEITIKALKRSLNKSKNQVTKSP